MENEELNEIKYHINKCVASLQLTAKTGNAALQNYVLERTRGIPHVEARAHLKNNISDNTHTDQHD